MAKRKEQTFGRRSSEDQQRDKLIYEYLLTFLTDLGVSEDTKKPNESSIASQWGQQENRIFIRRVLRSVLSEYYTEEEKASVDTVPGLTLGKLIDILAGIQNYRAKKRKRQEVSDEQVPRILTRAEKLTALRKFSQLSLQEQKKLNLRSRSGELLLQQLVETVTDPVKGLKSQDIIPFFQNTLNIYNNLKQSEISNSQKSSINLAELINNNVENLLKEHYQDLNKEYKEKQISHLTNKIQNEVNKIEYQSGARQANYVLKPSKKQEGQNLPVIFIHHLTSSLIENEILTDEFSVFIKYFEIEKIPTLPLELDDTEDRLDKQISLLNSKLLDTPEDKEDIKGLAKQLVYKVRVYFAIKLPKHYNYRFGEEESKKISNFNGDKLEICEEVTGIGSPINHIIAAINRVLLWNIPSLKDYLPVAREIYYRDEVIGENSNSPVWAHTIVTLCKKTDVDKAIKEEQEYEEVATKQEISYGQYCGFDLVEVAAQAALHARLRAIKQAGINSQEYLTQLCHSLEEKNALKKAENYLEFYPFSMRAMEGYLNQTIFQQPKPDEQKVFIKKYRKCDQQFVFEEIKPGDNWSLVAYEAHLKITQAYLREGLYRIAKEHLDVLKPHIEKGYLDNLLLANYYLCKFRYHYLTDLEDTAYYPQAERSAAVRQAEDSLNDAKLCLEKHLEIYNKIGEPAQTNFHPFFYLVSRLFSHRAKLYIFTPIYANRPPSGSSSLKEAIRMLEKARIYAARDGSVAHYSYWSAYQSLCYFMTAYLEPDLTDFSQEKCLNWANKLIDNAKVCYSYIGKKCYQQIKDNSGRITPNEHDGKYYEKYGNVNIQVVPLIKERELKKDEYDQATHILMLDLSVIKEINTDENKSIYLFGTHSTMILLSMGMSELCNEETDEQKLKARIEKAMTTFIYCSAIAEEGGKYHTGEQYYIDRIPTKDNSQTTPRNEVPGEFDSWLKILYPHRLTQFVDLGKIFAATCKAILLLYNSEYSYSKIEGLLESLLENSTNQEPGKILGQKKFNGHLATFVNGVKQYFNKIEGKQVSSSLIEIRKKVVKDILKIMRGEVDIRY